MSVFFQFFFLFFLSSSQVWSNYYDGKWTFRLGSREHVFERGAFYRGSPMVNVYEIAEYFKLELNASESKSDFVLKEKRSGRSVQFSTSGRAIRGFWGASRFSKTPRLVDKKLLVPLDFGDRVLRPLLTGEAPEPIYPRTLPFAADIVIDPGHGGNDHGAVVKEGKLSFHEKDIALKISIELKEALEKKGLRVALTRDKDVYLALPERTAFANRKNARLFLSIHMNTSPAKVRGYEIYLLSLKDKEDKEALKTISIENMQIPDDLEGGVEAAVADLRAQAHFESSLNWAKWVSSALEKSTVPARKRPILQGPFYVLYGASMPSLLLEFGYLDNKEDRKLFRNKEARARFLSPLVDILVKKIKEEKANASN